MLPFGMGSSKNAITGLTVKQENFTVLLSTGVDQTQAYIEAFGAGNYSEKGLKEKASRLKGQPAVKFRHDTLMREAAARSNIDRDEIVGWLKEIAIFGKQTQTRFTKEGSYDELKDGSSANSAIDKLIKMQGLYAAEKIETEIKAKGKFILNLKTRTDED